MDKLGYFVDTRTANSLLLLCIVDGYMCIQLQRF